MPVTTDIENVVCPKCREMYKTAVRKYVHVDGCGLHYPSEHMRTEDYCPLCTLALNILKKKQKEKEQRELEQWKKERLQILMSDINERKSEIK